MPAGHACQLGLCRELDGFCRLANKAFQGFAPHAKLTCGERNLGSCWQGQQLTKNLGPVARSKRNAFMFSLQASLLLDIWSGCSSESAADMQSEAAKTRRTSTQPWHTAVQMLPLFLTIAFTCPPHQLPFCKKTIKEDAKDAQCFVLQL